ncbi:hypothetical protein H1R20_g5898, partial [Candolleomyces eurysporus]
MSALAAALAAFASSQPLVVADSDDHPADLDLRPSSPVSLPSLSHSGVSSSSSSLYDVPAPSVLASMDRPNDHLAVLLEKDLWKPDRLASVCDNFYCRVSFGLFERRHHCRKCGGVFCGACTQRTTPLLDTSNLPFVHPPRNHRIVEYESPESPIVNARVCDDCYDQVYGVRSSPHTPTRPSMKRSHSHPISMFKMPLSALSRRDGSDSSLSSRGSLPSDSPTSQRTRSLRPSGSNSSLNTTHSAHSNSCQRTRNTSTLRTAHLPLSIQLERSYGELDAYPLRRSSVLCKATGGGRWEPKQSPVLDGYRPPVVGGKAPYELEMEREEREERRRRQNPIITDGEIRYRYMSQRPESVDVVLSRRSPQATN